MVQEVTDNPSSFFSAAKKLLLALGLSLFLASCANHTEIQQMTSFEELDNFAKQYTQNNRTALAYQVLKPDRIIHQGIFGFQGPNRTAAVTEQTRFRWWSITKLFTAMAILKLQQDQLLDIHMPIGHYLPALAGQHPVLHQLPVRTFLNHTSGMGDTYPDVIGWMDSRISDSTSQKQFMTTLLADYLRQPHPLPYPIYSDVNYMLLGELIAAVSGKDYRDFIEQSLLQPLMLDGSSFDYIEDRQAIASHPVGSMETFVLPFFYWDKMELLDRIDHGRFWFRPVYPKNDAPSGLLGSITDLQKLANALLTNHQPFVNKSLLGKLTRHAVPYRNKPQISHAMSFKIFRKEPDYLQQIGTGPGYSALLRIYPEQEVALVFLANDMKFPRFEFVDSLAKLVIAKKSTTLTAD